MSSIDFEKDQREDLNSVNEAKNLSDQVVKLKQLEDEYSTKEKELKELNAHFELQNFEAKKVLDKIENEISRKILKSIL